MGKTGLSLLRYNPQKIVVVIDSESAGHSLRDITGLPLERDIPIVATIADALQYQPQAVAIGIAPLGGRLPEAWLEDLRFAVRHGVSVWNGLHTPLKSDPQIAECLGSGVYVWDMRKEPPGLMSGKGRARQLACKRVLFVGTDMAIGKMTAALECDKAARKRKVRSKFIATGQAGMMIAGDGVCLDAVRVDFASGAVETELMKDGPDNAVLWIEGQGSLLNPASTATLPLIRGSQPTHMILVHRAKMRHLQEFPEIPVPPLSAVIELYETVASAGGAFGAPKVCAIALNTWGLDENDARAAVEEARATGLPCTDAVRYGADVLLNAVGIA
jgi:uncharacterized NAD-dependent epimerase/dehydratase family protein